MFIRFFLFFFILRVVAFSEVSLGVDLFFSQKIAEELKGQRVGLITNQTGVNGELISTLDLFRNNQNGFYLSAIFSPEHGLFGEESAAKEVENRKIGKIPVYSLHGKTRRPTKEMLKDIDVLVYDIQDIGCRSYTYASTLYYVMEEAAKYGIPVIVLDRPNPLGGNLVDGPMLEENYRSFIGYIDVPYCHGMTIGELARYFNEEYKIRCKLRVVLMSGWKRAMSFKETGLSWIPTSPYIPDVDSPFFYATTGLIGELGILSIGIGYTLPFKIVGAPWVAGQELALKLNAQNIPGVKFVPFYFTPHYGLYKGELCQGVLLLILNQTEYKPVKVQFFILGVLKSMYPEIFAKKIGSLQKSKKELFQKATGGEGIFLIFSKEKYPAWKMTQYEKEKRESYLEKRKRYLLYN